MNGKGDGPHYIEKLPFPSYNEMIMDIEQIRNYCLSKPCVTEDMPFGPEYVVFRIGGKIFCCLALVLGNVVQLKWNPDEFDDVIEQYSFVRQAWHWHKRHMIQFDLDEAPVPDAVAKDLIDRSYAYARLKLPRKLQQQLDSDYN
ncbi:MAG: MmcQ/YjbR family DNA-binding protein [Muribaculaceae bacterium]|nr:MmcQ/YjbR family DNA-binding protein [Muribaculaceae bacterium]